MSAVTVLAAVAAAVLWPLGQASDYLPCKWMAWESWSARGCEAAQWQNNLCLTCSLSGARVSLSALRTEDRTPTRLSLHCQADGNRLGRFSCEELRNYTSSHLEDFLNLNEPWMEDTVGLDRVLQRLELVDCELNQLRCLLELVSADDVAEIYLRNISTPLLPEHLQDIKFVKKLFLTNFDKNITELPYAALGQLPKLNVLRVRGGEGVRLAADGPWRKEQQLLLELMLEDIGLRAVPARAFHPLYQLRNLSLSENWIETLDENAFHSLPKLQHMWLNNNRLRSLPPALFRYTRTLEELTLKNNLIDHLPDGVFSNLAALETLDLSHNNLKHLSGNVFVGLSNIRMIILSHNELSVSTDENRVDGWLKETGLWWSLSTLRTLTHLDLNHNRLKQVKIDELMDNLHNLLILELTYNDITELKIDYIAQRTVLVDMRHNNITRVQLQFPQRVSSGEEILLLDDNPFRCDCDMFAFLSLLAGSVYFKKYNLGTARCASPPELAGALLATLSPARLLCPKRDCPQGCSSCALRPATLQLELQCEREPQPLWPLPAATNTVWLRLGSPPMDAALLPPIVRYLNLSGLQLVTPPAASRAAPNLTVDLSNNSLTSAPIALLDANIKVLLSDNPLACDCEHRESLAALRRHGGLVQDGDKLRCADGKMVRSMDPDMICAGRDALVMAISVSLAVVLFAFVVFRYRTELRLILGRFQFFDFLLSNNDLGVNDKMYDAFVSYSHHDEEFVREQLVPALEGGRRPLRLCLHYRDWGVGDLIPEQIERSVLHSWRTIVVMSEAFVRSMWGRREFCAAHNLDRVVVLVLGDGLRAMDVDRELRAYKNTHSCIMASHSLVWDRIRDAVYRSKRRALPPTVEEKVTDAIDEAR